MMPLMPVLPLRNNLLPSIPQGDDGPRVIYNQGGRSSRLDVANLPSSTTVSAIPAAAFTTAPSLGLPAG